MTDNELTLILTISFILILFVTAIISYLVFNRKGTPSRTRIEVAKMQIVIEIPENEYRLIKKIYEKNDNVESTYSYIYHGIPLPKGHGKLKDIDAFIAKVQADRQHAIYTRSWTADDVLDALSANYTPTIIEADGGRKDEISN